MKRAESPLPYLNKCIIKLNDIARAKTIKYIRKPYTIPLYDGALRTIEGLNEWCLHAEYDFVIDGFLFLLLLYSSGSRSREVQEGILIKNKM